MNLKWQYSELFPAREIHAKTTYEAKDNHFNCYFCSKKSIEYNEKSQQGNARGMGSGGHA
jgi:hypothetical protein